MSDKTRYSDGNMVTKQCQRVRANLARILCVGLFEAASIIQAKAVFKNEHPECPTRPIQNTSSRGCRIGYFPPICPRYRNDEARFKRLEERL